MKKIILTVLLLTLFTSCKKSTTEPIENQFSDFEGTHWVLKNVHYKDGTVKSINEIVKVKEGILINSYHLDFTTNNEIRGMAGCNAVKYVYKVDGNNIQLDFYGGMTEVYCPFTMEFWAILGYSTTYSATENTLIFNSNYNEFTGLEFVRVKETEFKLENLINTKWKLFHVSAVEGYELPFKFGYDDDETRSDFLNYEVEFMADGTLKGVSNCNSFDGEYDLDKVKIAITPGSVTEMACPYSNEFLAIFNSSTYVHLIGETLIMYSSTEGYKTLHYRKVEND